MVDLDVLHQRLVVALADAGGAAAAARALQLPQETVLERLDRVEQAAGLVLFEGDRSDPGARLTPTPEGVAVVGRARDALRATATVPQHVGGGRDLDELRVRFAVLPFPSMEPFLRQTFRGVRWTSAASSVQGGLDAVAAGDADIFFGLVDPLDAEIVVPAGLRTIAVLEDQVCVMLPASHRLAGSEVVELGLLRGSEWAMLDEPVLQRALVRACRSTGFEPRITVVPGADGHCTEAVATGAMVSTSSRLAAGDTRIVVRPCPGLPVLQWIVVHRPDDRVDRYADAVVRIARAGYRLMAAVRRLGGRPAVP